MRVQVVDPSAFTPPYDHALCAALARAGAEVRAGHQPLRLRRACPRPTATRVRELFYRRGAGRARVAAAPRPASSPRTSRTCCATGAGRRRRRRALPVADAPVARRASAARPAAGADRARSAAARAAPRAVARPAAAARPRRRRGRALRVRRGQLVERLGAAGGQGARDPSRRVRARGDARRGPAAAGAAGGAVHGGRAGGAVLRLLRPYKGLETLLQAWRGIDGRRAVDRRAADDGPGAAARAGGRGRAVRAAVRLRRRGGRRCFDRADVVVLPYARTERFDQSGVLATALAFGKAVVRHRHRRLLRGRRRRCGAAGRPGGSGGACATALAELVADPAAARAAGGGGAGRGAGAVLVGRGGAARRWRSTSGSAR